MSALRLVVVQGESRGAAVDVGPFDVVIGRERTCDLRIRDAKCSRRHAHVVTTLAGVRIEDLGSTNGTYVNGVRLAEPRPLMPGDQIGIGATIIEARLQGAPDQPMLGVRPLRPHGSP